MIFFPSRLSWRMRTVGFELRLGMRAMYMGYVHGDNNKQLIYVKRINKDIF